MEVLLLLLILVGFFFLVRSARKSTAQHSQATVVASRDPKWKYAHIYKGTEIMLNPGEQIVRLCATFGGQAQQRDYPYADIRGWEFKVASGGFTQTFGTVGVNTALGVGISNIAQHRRNEAQTGLFLTVRDIEFPEWQIKFPAEKSRELELKRWMEILRQEINRD